MGYPNGLWDQKNNRPIARKGITATHPGINYNGKQEFLIDVACFPGSSGSPVLLYNPCNYIDRMDNCFSKPRVKFLGILRAGPVHIIRPLKDITIKMPNNLGMVINSYKILDFIPLLNKLRAKAV